MKKYMKRMLSGIVLASVTSLCVLSASAMGGTDGTELHVLEPDQLIIQLGEAWAGVEFEMKTDAGMYPGVITVGEDGVLRTEIGGSREYILSCLSSNIQAPVPETEITTEQEGIASPAVPEIAEKQEAILQKVEKDEQSAEIKKAEALSKHDILPVWQIALFGGGLMIALSCLIGMRFTQKRKHVENEDDYVDL